MATKSAGSGPKRSTKAALARLAVLGAEADRLAGEIARHQAELLWSRLEPMPAIVAVAAVLAATLRGQLQEPAAATLLERARVKLEAENEAQAREVATRLVELRGRLERAGALARPSSHAQAVLERLREQLERARRLGAGGSSGAPG
jgi:hypothetical protein